MARVDRPSSARHCRRRGLAMRLRDLVVMAVVVAMTAGVGCSRLTFVKQKFKNDYHRTAPDYAVSDDPEDARRIAAIDEVALAQQGIQSGRLDEATAHANAALKADPKSADAYTLLGMIQDQHG